MKTRDSHIELYIHIPFCIRKCNYCDFLSFQADDIMKQMYVNALCEEIKYYGATVPEGTVVDTIYVGGGTPSSLETALLDKIFLALDNAFTMSREVEVSMECNPGTVTGESLRAYKSMGVNRLSFGLQSTNDEELKALGRIHDYRSFINSYQLALKAGYDNVNVDVMYGLPYQKLDTLRKTLTDITLFRPNHLSVYSLIIEEGTPFYEKYEEDHMCQCMGQRTSYLPSEDELCEMTDYVNAYLRSRGYEQYEISNYARAGYECKHNIGYWKRKPYIGMGIGAASLYEEKRFNNTSNIEDYISNWNKNEAKPICENVETLSATEAMEEYMMLGLRMNVGVSPMEFNDAFGLSMNEVFANQINRLIERGLVVREGNIIKPTRHGLELQNIIAREFIED